MSGDLREPGRSAPIELTDDDVRELAGTRTGRVAAVARLKAQVPTERVGRLETARPTPAAMSAKDLEAAVRSGRLPDAVLRRLPTSDVTPEAPTEAAGRPRPGPTKRPPKGQAASS